MGTHPSVADACLLNGSSRVPWTVPHVESRDAFYHAGRSHVRPFLMMGLRTDTVFKFLVCTFCIFYFFLVSSL